jgi:hypothetical protein
MTIRKALPRVREETRRIIPAARWPLVVWRHRGISPADVFLVSYPRSGRTWLRLMLAELLKGGEVDFNEGYDVVPMVGSHVQSPPTLPHGGRLLVSHEPFHSVSGRYQKVIHLVRDGRDVAVSAYYHYLRNGRITGTFDEFLPAYIEGKIGGYGSWESHVMSWLNARLTSNHILLVRYEDLMDSPEEGLLEIADYLDLTVDRERISAAVRDNTAERMRTKEQTANVLPAASRSDIPFVREAKAGTWSKEFSASSLRSFERSNARALRALGYALHASAEVELH